MPPNITRYILIGLAIVFAIYAGNQIASDQLVIPIIAAIVFAFIIVESLLRANAETLIVSLLTVGYILGNRGFAQLTPVQAFPLFPGELGIAIFFATAVIFSANHRRLPFRIDTLAKIILLWLILAAIRLPFDIYRHGILAIRDAELVYYSIYFFLVQSVRSNERYWRVYSHYIVISLTLLPLVYLLFVTYRDTFLTQITISGIPLVFFKGDLASMYLALAFVYMYFIYERRKRTIFLFYSLWCALLTIFFISRAAWVGMFAAMLIFFLARIYRPILVFSTSLVFCGIVWLCLLLATNQNLRESKIYSVYEHVISMTDFAGQRTYVSQEAYGTGSNNRFRFTWWRNIVVETWTNGPFFGLGFGHDLAQMFVLEYYGYLDDFSARSPHNVFLTIFGRMGFLGLIVFFVIVLIMARYTASEIAVVRSTAKFTERLCLLTMAWIVLSSACFGVVLEGPMGAVLFWIFLGAGYRVYNDDFNSNHTNDNPSEI